MPLSTRHNCLFLHVPRTGGASIEVVLDLPLVTEPSLGDQADALNGTHTIEGFEGYSAVFQFQHLTPAQILALTGAKTLADLHPSRPVSFCFVRNPWERVVSDYANWYARFTTSFEDYVNRLAILVRFICDRYEPDLRARFYRDYSKLVYQVFGEREWVDPHFFPQHFYVYASDRQLVDHVGRFEHFGDDARRLLHRVGVDLALPHLNASQHGSYVDMFDSETAAIVQDVYATDIERFGYQFE